MNSVLRVSSLRMVRDAVVADAGAALLPLFLAADEVAGALLEVWGENLGAASPCRLVSSKVAAFIQYCIDEFPDRRIHSLVD